MIKAALLTCLLAAVMAEESQESRYVLKYQGEDHSHVQKGNAGRAVTGYYSYKDVSGKTYLVHYVADENGYRVIGSGGDGDLPNLTKAASNAPVTAHDALVTAPAPDQPVVQEKTAEEVPVQVANENLSVAPLSPEAAVDRVKPAEEDPPSIPEVPVADAKTADVPSSENVPATDGKKTATPLVYYLVAGFPVAHPSAGSKSAEDKKTDKHPLVYYIVPGPTASAGAGPVSPVTGVNRDGPEKNPFVPVPYLRNSPYGYPVALPFGYPFYG